MLLFKISVTVIAILIIVFIKTLLKLSIHRKRVEREIAGTRIDKIKSPGSVKNLTILPVVDYYSDQNDLKTEAGVSYHITADDTQILLDMGANSRKEHPSPLQHNMKQLNKKFDDLSFIFFSHNHLDHVGGLREQREMTFSVSTGTVDLPVIPVYSPVEMKPSIHNPGPKVNVITEPCVIKEGIVSIGAMPRALYLLGYTLENALAFNVEGKGIVLVIGCGHQSIDRIIERARALFDEPIYGIVGGLHLPVGGGRLKIGPIDIQPVVGTDRFPWKPMNENDTAQAIEAVKRANPSLVALSPHDSSDRSLEQFRRAFGDAFQVIKVGRPIVI